jgi:histone H3/H4
MEEATQALMELLMANNAHLRVLQQLEVERIARETGEPVEKIKERVQILANQTMMEVRKEIFEKHSQFRL